MEEAKVWHIIIRILKRDLEIIQILVLADNENVKIKKLSTKLMKKMGAIHRDFVINTKQNLMDNILLKYIIFEIKNSMENHNKQLPKLDDLINLYFL